MNQPPTPDDKPRARIDNIELVFEIPPPERQKPHTLYVSLREGADLKDRHLGKFMDSWSGLERVMQILLWRLLGGDYAAAEVLFYSTLNIKTQTDMLTGLVVLKHKQQASKWRNLKDLCLKLSNSRNHLVHGHWIPEITVSGGSQEQPIATKIEWFRVYMTGDPELNRRAAFQSDEPKTGQHRYSLERIQRKTEQVDQLASSIDGFIKKVIGQTPPSG